MASRSQEVSSGLWLRGTISLLTVPIEERWCESSPEQHSPKGKGQVSIQETVTGAHRVAQEGEESGRGLGNVLGDKLQKGDEADGDSRKDGKRRAPGSQRRIPIRGCDLPRQYLWDICAKPPARDVSILRQAEENEVSVTHPTSYSPAWLVTVSNP